MDRVQEIALRIGRRLAGRRMALKWSQEFLAEQIGVEPETISRVERGIHTPSLKSLIRLIDTLGMTFCQVVQVRDDPISEVERIQLHLARLSSENRRFVTDVVEQLCQHLARAETRTGNGLQPSAWPLHLPIATPDPGRAAERDGQGT